MYSLTQEANLDFLSYLPTIRDFYLPLLKLSSPLLLKIPFLKGGQEKNFLSTYLGKKWCQNTCVCVSSAAYIHGGQCTKIAVTKLQKSCNGPERLTRHDKSPKTSFKTYYWTVMKIHLITFFLHLGT